MGAANITPLGGPWGRVAAQSRHFLIFVLPFAVGLLGAAAVALTVGFHDTDEESVGLIRLGGALLTGLVAGVVGRGLWGWLAASAGATFGFLPFFLSDLSEPSLVLAGAIFSCVALAPGYGIARALAYALRLPSLSPARRSAALRVPLRRLLRLGVLLTGAGVAVAVASAAALGAIAGLVMWPVFLAAVGVSYVLYRLVDGLDRGDRAAAPVFTVVYAVIGLGSFGLMLAAEAPVGWAALETLVPCLFMALAPWLLLRLVRQQPVPMPYSRVEADHSLAEPSAGQRPPTGETDTGRPAQRRPLSIALNAVAVLICLAVAVSWIVGSLGSETGLAPQPAVISHDALEVEALLPASVAGRQLAIWSVRGEATLKLWGLTAEEISTTTQELASMGVRLDDLVQATAGRTDVEHDPPYVVFAFRIQTSARDLLGGYALASIRFTKDTADWQLEERVLGGKTVQVGAADLIVQDEHQRGQPYLYGSKALDTLFVVMTDDEAWAEEAIRQLPE